MITKEYLELTRLVASRLERLSADSLWARRASGCRGALLKAIDELENRPESVDAERLGFLLNWGMDLLKRGAREIPDAEAMNRAGMTAFKRR